MLPNKSLGVVLAITGILLFSSKAVMVKLAYQYGVDTVSLLLFRMVFSLPIYVAIAAFNRPKEKIAG
ncbi:MAG: EamA/RhaT family transporter, partial [Marinoscillum sp.]